MTGKDEVASRPVLKACCHWIPLFEGSKPLGCRASSESKSQGRLRRLFATPPVLRSTALRESPGSVAKVFRSRSTPVKDLGRFSAAGLKSGHLSRAASLAHRMLCSVGRLKLQTIPSTASCSAVAADTWNSSGATSRIGGSGSSPCLVSGTARVRGKVSQIETIVCDR